MAGGQVLAGDVDASRVVGKDKRVWRSDCALASQRLNLLPPSGLDGKFDLSVRSYYGSMFDKRLLSLMLSSRPG
jgi:hypothetical protein